MTIGKTGYIWFDGQLVPWDKAQVHVAAHVLHYGSSVFEGIRAYDTSDGSAIFCLEPHVDRLFNSAKVYRMEIPYTKEDIRQAIIDTVKANQHTACYIRPLVFRGFDSFSVNPQTCPVRVAIITIEWGRYLGPEAIEQGVDVGVSSWRRMAPNTFPAAAKIGGQYINSQLIAMEAAEHGYTEGVALDINGFVSEGSGENIFLVCDGTIQYKGKRSGTMQYKGKRSGTILTPPLASSILQGVTRRCVIALAEEMDFQVREELIPRELLYIADEAFFTGTAAEITPIRSVDGITVGAGHRGPVTERLQDEFFGITSGQVPDRHGWLTPVSGSP